MAGQPSARLWLAVLLTGAPPAAHAAVHQVSEAAQAQAAVDAAAPGDVLEFSAGRHVVSLVVTKPLILRAAAGAEVILSPQADGAAVEVRQADPVRIEAISIEGGRVGIRVSDGAALELSDSRLSGQADACVEVRASEALSSRNSFSPASGAALRVLPLSYVASEQDRFSTPPVQEAPLEAYITAARSTVVLREAAMSGRAGAGLVASEHSAVELNACRLTELAGPAVSASESEVTIRDSHIEAAAGHGMLLRQYSRLVLQRTQVLGTVEAGGAAVGIELAGGSRARIEDARLSNNAQHGLVVTRRSIATISRTQIEQSALRGLLVSDGSRVLVRRCTVSGHREYGVEASSGSEIALFDSLLGRNGLGILADAAGRARVGGAGNVFEENQADYRGAVSPTVQRRAEASAGFRLDQSLSAVVTVRLAPESGEPDMLLRYPNHPVRVVPGTYAVSVEIPRVQPAIAWGAVTVDRGETVIELTSGVRLVSATAPVLGWRAQDAAHPERVYAAYGGQYGMPLPPGRYRIQLGQGGGQWRAVGPADGVVVTEGVTDVALEVAQEMFPVPFDVRPAMTMARPGTALPVTIVVPNPDSLIRLSIIGPDAKWRSAPDWSHRARFMPAKQVGLESEIPFGEELPHGWYLLVLELADPHSGERIGVVAKPIVLALQPLVRLRIPSYQAPGTAAKWSAMAAGLEGKNVQLLLSAWVDNRTYWLTRGGTEGIVPTAEASVRALVPRMRDGATVIFEGQLPGELGAKGPIPVRVLLKDAATGAMLAQDTAALYSCKGSVRVGGRVLDHRRRPVALPYGALTVEINALGTRLNTPVTVRPDATFLAQGLEPGIYRLTARALDGEGRVVEAPPLVLETQCEGRHDVELVLKPAVAVRQMDPGAAALRWLDTMIPEAQAGCPAVTDESASFEHCACGRLPVCVYSGAGLGSAALADAAASPGRHAGPQSFAAERALADTMNRVRPCLQAVPVDTYWLEGFSDVMSRMELVTDELAQARGRGHADRVSELEARFNDLMRQAFYVASQPAARLTACPVSVVLSGTGTASIQAALRGTFSDGEQLTASASSAIEAWADDLSAQFAPPLEALRESWLCACKAHETSCTTDALGLPSSDYVCDHELSCCGTVQNRWSEYSGTPDSRGVTAVNRQEIASCCGDAAAAPQSRPRERLIKEGAACSDTGTLLSLDFDCDGLGNIDDPTPLVQDAPLF